MIFHSQPNGEHAMGKMQNNYTFYETTVFSLNVQLNMFLK